MLLLIAPVPEPTGIGAVIAAVIAIGSAILRLFTGSNNQVKRAIQQLGDGLGRLGGAVEGLGRRVAKVAGILWRGYIVRTVKLLRKLLERIRKLIARILKPVLKVLRRLNDILDRYYKNVLQPMLTTISRMRRGLLLLRVFGVKWAQKVDERLFKLEQKIFGQWLLIKQKVNLHATLINALLTRDGLLQRAMLVRSVFRDIGPVVALIVNSGITPGGGELFRQLTEQFKPRTLDQVIDDFNSGRTATDPAVVRAITRFEESFDRG